VSAVINDLTCKVTAGDSAEGHAASYPRRHRQSPLRKSHISPKRTVLCQAYPAVCEPTVEVEASVPIVTRSVCTMTEVGHGLLC
jgi:hypothetical protein